MQLTPSYGYYEPKGLYPTRINIIMKSYKILILKLFISLKALDLLQQQYILLVHETSFN